jgi:hypothetical protein
VSAEHRVIVKVDPKPKTPAGWLAKGKAVNSAATAAGATFSPIAALLTQFGDDVILLDKAQTAAANRGKTETAARNAQWRATQKSFRAFVAGVQGLCDAAPDAAHAEAIAAAALLDTKLSSAHTLPALRGKALGNGAVRLYGRRPLAKRAGAFYEWAMSSDGGKTWTPLATTNTARTQAQGLTVGATISFRYRTTLKNVTSDWSQAIGVLVH